jgi:hypothetical protein
VRLGRGAGLADNAVLERRADVLTFTTAKERVDMGQTLDDPRLSGPVPGEPVSTLGQFDLARLGYVAQEWFLAGTAGAWRAAGEPSDDGRWAVDAAGSAPFKTRVLACGPADPHRFNGTVVVEWLNVSGGGDGSPDWFFLHRHLMREGAAWVGVSAQKAGIDGGGLFDSGQHLKNVAPERYGVLTHPGDAFSFDIFSQAGLALRAGTGPLADLDVETLLAVGESQSATFLVTYVNAIDPLAAVYDGFLIHGRGAQGASLEEGMGARRVSEGETLDLASRREAWRSGHRIREDARVPVITVQSETDVMMFAGFRARQPDNARFRLWEIAGAAHFDTYGLIAAHRDDGSLAADELAALVAPTDEVIGQKAASLVNSGPQQHYVLNAAIAHLAAWVRQGGPPPSADRRSDRLSGGRGRQQLQLDGGAEVHRPGVQAGGAGNRHQLDRPVLRERVPLLLPAHPDQRPQHLGGGEGARHEVANA